MTYDLEVLHTIRYKGELVDDWFTVSSTGPRVQYVDLLARWAKRKVTQDGLPMRIRCRETGEMLCSQSHVREVSKDGLLVPFDRTPTATHPTLPDVC